MTAVYRWSAADTLDVELTVTPERDLRRFELFLASYFQGFATAMAYVRQPGGGGRFYGSRQDRRRLADISPRRRGGGSLPMAAGIGHPIPCNGRSGPAMPAPLALRRDAASGLTAVLMSRPGDCFAVSMPYGEDQHRSLYFSLFGGDLKAKQAVSAGLGW